MLFAATQWAGIALFLVPVPVAVVILVVGARRQRVDTFLLLLVAVTLLPAIWATAVRAGWGGCDGCLTTHQRDWMTVALASLPLLALAIGLLFAGRRDLAAGAAILGQLVLGVGVWLPNKSLAFLMFLLVAGEVAYIALGRISQRNMEAVSGGNGHPGGTRVLAKDE
jgi:hypothetical protein